MSTDSHAKPVLQTVGDTDAAACDPDGDACAIPPVTHS